VSFGDSLPAGTVDIGITMSFGPGASEQACLKALDVAALEVQPGGQRLLVPVQGSTLDLSAVPRPGPNSLCVGVDTTTVVLLRSWGAVKAHYR
jgi:hypothetical protein